ncbi:MAG: MBL fold metallo-hydrolase [Gemmatimonadota bacterium]
MPRDFTIDVQHQGRKGCVAVRALETDAGLTLVDTGPGSALGALEAGLTAAGFSLTDVHAILLTHIHLDHAGATGSVVKANPAIEVFVHELGATHLIDPTKLLASATRVFGDRMDTLWGEFLAVPRERVRILQGGEAITVANRSFEVAYTPGHAVHHVAYYERATGTAFVGDTGGMRVSPITFPLPVTPPSDFNLEDWQASLDRILAFNPERLFHTHFDLNEQPVEQLGKLRQGLRDWTDAAARCLALDTDDASRAHAFADWVAAWLSPTTSAADVESYAAFADFQASWYGIARYLRKKA